MRLNAQYTIYGKPASEPKRQPMKKRLVIGKLLKGDKRVEGETFVEYKERLKLEKSLLRDYQQGVWVTTEEYKKNKKNA
tara:strand:- start:430 stop:666 length:237 start_codon:yes stop_codon:yes gene_type:complete